LILYEAQNATQVVPLNPAGGGEGGGNTATIFRFPRGGLMELALLDQPILRELML
jgi:hypothetical protein